MIVALIISSLVGNGLYAASKPRSHHSLFFQLPHPFYAIKPHKITLLTATPLLATPTLKGKKIGSLAEGTEIKNKGNIPTSKGFLPFNNGWVPFDFTADKHQFLSQKSIDSAASINGTILTGSLSYVSSSYWTFSIKDSNNHEVFKRSLLKERALLRTNRIGLFDFVPIETEANHANTAAWLLALESKANLFIPFFQNGKIKVTHELLNLWQINGEHRLIVTFHDGTLDIWQTKTVPTRKNAPIKVIRIPYIIRFTFHKNQPPTRQIIVPPNDIKLWPTEARDHFSSAEQYVTSLHYGLNILKNSSCEDLKKKGSLKGHNFEVLKSLWENIPKDLKNTSGPRWIKRA